MCGCVDSGDALLDGVCVTWNDLAGVPLSPLRGQPATRVGFAGPAAVDRAR